MARRQFSFSSQQASLQVTSSKMIVSCCSVPKHVLSGDFDSVSLNLPQSCIVVLFRNPQFALVVCAWTYDTFKQLLCQLRLLGWDWLACFLAAMRPHPQFVSETFNSGLCGFNLVRSLLEAAAQIQRVQRYLSAVEKLKWAIATHSVPRHLSFCHHTQRYHRPNHFSQLFLLRTKLASQGKHVVGRNLPLVLQIPEQGLDQGKLPRGRQKWHPSRVRRHSCVVVCPLDSFPATSTARLCGTVDERVCFFVQA
mmetsp:Transcript_16837/g.29771  ORF Transcript_16837/g.29771 Transcript_16837/m.29771 type:complete len:252 (+) Transcript_16837:164-919(+)